MGIQHGVENRPARLLAAAAAAAIAGLLLLTAQAQAAPPREREAPRMPSFAQNNPHSDHGRPHAHERESTRDHEAAGPRNRDEHRGPRDRDGFNGPRGRPPMIRPPIHPHPPPPVIVVPPCKRGGPGITPC